MLVQASPSKTNRGPYSHKSAEAENQLTINYTTMRHILSISDVLQEAIVEYQKRRGQNHTY